MDNPFDTVEVVKKPRVKISNTERRKLSELPINKTTMGIAKQDSHPSKEIVPSFCFLEITFAMEANNAPPPAADVIIPNPFGPRENIPSAIKGSVSKTPLPINEVKPLNSIDNLII